MTSSIHIPIAWPRKRQRLLLIHETICLHEVRHCTLLDASPNQRSPCWIRFGKVKVKVWWLVSAVESVLDQKKRRRYSSCLYVLSSWQVGYFRLCNSCPSPSLACSKYCIICRLSLNARISHGSLLPPGHTIRKVSNNIKYRYLYVVRRCFLCLLLLLRH